MFSWATVSMQKNDLARMYRLFQRIPKGLEPVAESFKKHVESEGMKLVKEATEAATAKKDKDAGKPSKDSGNRLFCHNGCWMTDCSMCLLLYVHCVAQVLFRILQHLPCLACSLHPKTAAVCCSSCFCSSVQLQVLCSVTICRLIHMHVVMLQVVLGSSILCEESLSCMTSTCCM